MHKSPNVVQGVVVKANGSPAVTTTSAGTPNGSFLMRCSAHPRIIYVDGVSCSGKTTLIHAMKRFQLPNRIKIATLFIDFIDYFNFSGHSETEIRRMLGNSEFMNGIKCEYYRHCVAKMEEVFAALEADPKILYVIDRCVPISALAYCRPDKQNTTEFEDYLQYFFGGSIENSHNLNLLLLVNYTSTFEKRTKARQYFDQYIENLPAYQQSQNATFEAAYEKYKHHTPNVRIIGRIHDLNYTDVIVRGGGGIGSRLVGDTERWAIDDLLDYVKRYIIDITMNCI